MTHAATAPSHAVLTSSLKVSPEANNCSHSTEIATKKIQKRNVRCQTFVRSSLSDAIVYVQSKTEFLSVCLAARYRDCKS